MNKPILLILTILSIGMGFAIDFLILRHLMRKMNMPRDRRQQVSLAAGLTILLTISSIVRIRQLAAVGGMSPVNQ